MAFCNTEYMSEYQKNLYRERQVHDNSSRTYQSDIFEIYDQHQNATADQLKYLSRSLREGDCSSTNVKVPWGRSRSYAGDGPICLPTEHRPKCEPPPVLQKTHHHFGSGLFPYPRGYPFSQYYDLTQLKKSNLRWNDELIPRPSTSQLHDKQIQVSFPQEHPLSSHMSRQALFPKFDTPKEDASSSSAGKIENDCSLPALVPTDPPPTMIVHKAMGNFARREICTPQITSVRQPANWSLTNVQRLPTRNAWFSRHNVISEFNKQYPSVIPTIALKIQKKKQADWLVNSANAVSS